MKQKRTQKKRILLLTALILIIAMIQVQVFAAAGDFEIGRVATYSEKARGEAGGMYFYEANGRILCCAASIDSDGAEIAQMQNRDFNPVLCDGETIYYVNYVSDGTYAHVLPVICRSDVSGENQKTFTKTKGKRYDEMYLLSIYNGKLYFFTRDTLKSLTLSSGAVKTLKKNFIGWDKLQIRATKGISATSRYIYGTFPAEPDKVYLYDCKTGNMKKLSAGEPIAIISGKLYYLDHLQLQDAALWRCDAKTGKNKKKLLLIKNLSQIRNLTSKSMRYATCKDGVCSCYSYDFATKKRTKISEEEYDAS